MEAGVTGISQPVLPMGTGARANIRAEVKPTPSSDGAPESAGRVLVVDDEAYITDLVSTAFRYEGFEVVEARNGRDALDAVLSSRPDLIILDVMLPDLDGLELTRRLRADGIRVPVVFLTARDATEDKIA